MSASRLADCDRDAPYYLPQSTYTIPSWSPSEDLSRFFPNFVSLLKLKPIARLSSWGRACC
jgi:hypothetical protein